MAEDFDYDSFLAKHGTKVKKPESAPEKTGSGFDYDSFLAKHGTSAKAELAPSIQPGSLRDPKDAISVAKELKPEQLKQTRINEEELYKLDIKDAKELIDSYESKGIDTGFQIVVGSGLDGVQEFVRPKPPQMGEHKGSEAEMSKYFRERENERYKKSVQEQTNAWDQSIEALHSPTTGLLFGSISIAGKVTDDISQVLGLETPEWAQNAEKYLELVDDPHKPKVPFGDLSAAQKAAYSVGTAIGFAGPGSVIHKGTKGMVKMGLNATGKSEAIFAAQKAATKYVGNLAGKHIPTDTAKALVGGFAGKFIKNAPTMALEGAAWEAIASGGDTERTLQGAFAFGVGGPLLGSIAATPQAKKALLAGAGFVSAGAKKVDNVLGDQVKKSIKKIVSDLDPKVAKALKKTEDNIHEVRPLWGLGNSLPDGLDAETYRRLRLMEGFKISSAHETSRAWAQAKVKKTYDKATKDLARISKAKEKYSKARDKLANSISKKENVQVSYTKLPQSIDEIKLPFGDKELSYIGRELLEDKFGDLNGLHAAASDAGGDYISVLIRAGFSQEQAALVNRSLTVQNPITRKVTAAGKEYARIKSGDLKRIEKRLAQLDKKEHNLQVKKATIQKNSLFDEAADPKILESTKDILAATKFETKALNAGIDIKAVDMPWIYKFKKILNYSDRHALLEAKTGIPVGQVTMDLIEGDWKRTHLMKALESFKVNDNLKALRKMGVQGEDAWEWMHYIRTDKKTGQIKWDPSEYKTKSYTVPAFEGAAPVPDVQNQLAGIRKALDWSYYNIAQSGQKVGYTPGYVPIKAKVGFFTSSFANKSKEMHKSGLLKKRKTGVIPEEERLIYHTDLYELAPLALRDQVNTAAFSASIDKVNVAGWMLRNAGLKHESDDLIEYAARAMGRTKGETIEVLSMDLVKKNKPLMEKLVIASGADRSIISDVAAATNEMMYNSYIGLSQFVLPKQFLQPLLVGAAEVGVNNVRHGYQKAYSPAFRKKTNEILARVRDRLYPESFDYDMLGEVQRRWLKYLVKASNLAGKPGMKAFTSLDKKNREVMFLASVRQFENAAKKGGKKLNSIMDDLLPSEKNRVLGAWQKHGSQEAMDTYGLIRAKRANFAYSLAEKSQFFSEGAARYIPFIHWGANQWMRHFQNLEQAAKGKPGPLAARIAYGVGGVAALEMSLNEVLGREVDLRGFTPQASMSGMSGMDLLTAGKGAYSVAEDAHSLVKYGELSNNPDSIVTWIRAYKKTGGNLFDFEKVWTGPVKTKSKIKNKTTLLEDIQFTSKKRKKKTSRGRGRDGY